MAKNRTFKQLTKEKDIKELHKFAKDVTEGYALSSYEYSQKCAAQDNNLTEKCLRQLMDYAIVMVLISRNTASRLLDKAVHNQQGNRQGNRQAAGGSSLRHHKELIRLREKNISENFATSEIKRIANDVANSKQSLSYFMGKYNIESERLLKLLLERAIAENIVSDEETEAIIARSLQTESAKKYFQKLLERRKETNESNSQ